LWAVLLDMAASAVLALMPAVMALVLSAVLVLAGPTKGEQGSPQMENKAAHKDDMGHKTGPYTGPYTGPSRAP